MSEHLTEAHSFQPRDRSVVVSQSLGSVAEGLFRCIDTDGDGFLSVAEVHEVTCRISIGHT